MKKVCVFLGFAMVICGLPMVHGLSLRRIYTLFTDPKTWNEAKSICADQFGQLVKIKGDSEIYELEYLDQFVWRYNLTERLHSGMGFWSGHHRPVTNSSTVKFQDCENITPNSVVQIDSQTCGHYNSTFDLSMAPCNEKHMFICERYEGDCWFQPILNEQPGVVDSSFPQFDIPAVDCAMTCRNYTDSSNRECWAFLYIYNPGGTPELACQMYTLSDSFVPTSGANVSSTSASALYNYATNRQSIPASSVDIILYTRMCFEGSLDMTVYSQYTNNWFYPETECATINKTVNEPVSDICFCATNEQPPIPKPISSEAKAEELIKELTIEASNTSAAQRKKTSAEDNRTSAVSVGYVGVALMSVVFGGLFLMDVRLLLAGVQTFIQSFKTESTA